MSFLSSTLNELGLDPARMNEDDVVGSGCLDGERSEELLIGLERRLASKQSCKSGEIHRVAAVAPKDSARVSHFGSRSCTWGSGVSAAWIANWVIVDTLEASGCGFAL